MKISKRLETICKLVPLNSKVADVGADHGLVEKYLLDHELCSYILAIENKKGPYTILKKALEKYKNVRISLSDGIEDIDETIDTLVIAGMGGINILEILAKNKSKLANIQNIIVDPHRDVSLFREKIGEFGFFVKEEKIVFEDKKFYNIISLTRGAKNYTFEEIMWGYNVTNLPEFVSYKESKLQELNKKLVSLQKSKNPSIDEINTIKNNIERLTKYGN